MTLLLTIVLTAAVSATVGAGVAHGATSAGNGLIAFETVRHGTTDIYVKAPDGSAERRLSSHPGRELDPAWSPDGSRIAYSSDESEEGHQNIWTMNADGTDKRLLTFGAQTTDQGNAGSEPSWSPDGSRIVYNNYGAIWVMNADGGGKVRLVPASEAAREPAWSPDGTRIAFILGWNIYTMAPDGSARTRLTATTAAERAPQWAPDGSALVYERGGQIWRMNPDGSGQVALTGGFGESGVLPAWSPDGTKIVFATDSFGSASGHEIAVMSPDGTNVALVPPAVQDVDTDPSWQPVAGDGTPPAVSSRAPAVNAKGVALGTNVTATFSEAVQGVSESTFTLQAAGGTAVTATVTYDPATRKATLDPSANLAADTTYTATLTGGGSAIRDLAGNQLTTTSWSFLTGPKPRVSSRTPAPNATGVAVGTNVTVTFSEGVQGVGGSTFTLKTATGTAVTATVSYDPATRKATLDPSADLAAGTGYTARLVGGTSGIRDLAGNPLQTTSWTFTTG